MQFVGRNVAPLMDLRLLSREIDRDGDRSMTNVRENIHATSSCDTSMIMPIIIISRGS